MKNLLYSNISKNKNIIYKLILLPYKSSEFYISIWIRVKTQRFIYCKSAFIW